MPLSTCHPIDAQKDIGLCEHIGITFHQIPVKTTADLVEALLDQHLNLVIPNEVIGLDNIKFIELVFELFCLHLVGRALLFLLFLFAVLKQEK